MDVALKTLTPPCSWTWDVLDFGISFNSASLTSVSPLRAVTLRRQYLNAVVPVSPPVL
jgi:hypothetical protein